VAEASAQVAHLFEHLAFFAHEAIDATGEFGLVLRHHEGRAAAPLIGFVNAADPLWDGLDPVFIARVLAAIATASQPPSVQDSYTERSDLLIAFLAFGAAVISLGFWLWSTVGAREG